MVYLKVRKVTKRLKVFEIETDRIHWVVDVTVNLADVVLLHWQLCLTACKNYVKSSLIWRHIVTILCTFML